ncbi:MAG: 16S rRNA (cytosine(967)-C(5))-methyltransferase RsmB [Gammaproteobacteria bacterium]
MSSARLLAARALLPVLRGEATLDDALRHASDKLEGRERAFLRELAFGVCRRYAELEGLLAGLLVRPMKAADADVRALLLIGIYQLRYLRVPDHAALAETVGACHGLRKPWARGLVNAVLRGYLARREELEARLSRAERLAHPQWLLEAIEAAWPAQAAAIIEAGNGTGPLSLRVNRLRGDRASWLAKARSAGFEGEASPIAEDGVLMGRAVDVEALPGFREGEVSVQDEAAQLAAELIAAEPGERILDACAAPGGKACHLLEHTPGLRLIALDSSANRLARVQENLQRLGLGAELREGDATQPDAWWDGVPFDRILVDAPCSGTGVIRRHPDIKVLRAPAQVRESAQLQSRILDALWPLLAPGGVLLYCTCSILPQENEAVIAAFLARTPSAGEWPLDVAWGQAQGCGRQLLPGEGSHDGFYFARLRRL